MTTVFSTSNSSPSAVSDKDILVPFGYLSSAGVSTRSLGPPSQVFGPPSQPPGSFPEVFGSSPQAFESPPQQFHYYRSTTSQFNLQRSSETDRERDRDRKATFSFGMVSW